MSINRICRSIDRFSYLNLEIKVYFKIKRSFLKGNSKPIIITAMGFKVLNDITPFSIGFGYA